MKDNEKTKKIVKLTIDTRVVEIEEGSTILDAARKLGIDIPTLCYLKDVNQIGACRMCLVEIEGARNYVTACTHPVSNDIVVRTTTPGLLEVRKTNLELILSNHNRDCLTCSRNMNCELQSLANRLGIKDIHYEGEKTKSVLDDLSSSIVRDTSKCILCKRCINVCKKVQEVNALTTINRGFNSRVGCMLDSSILKSTCINCGQCILNCPVAALKEKDDTQRVWEALHDDNLHVVVQTAPAVRVAIGEEFNMPFGTNMQGKLVAGLRQLGFDKVFDTNLGADLTIMEEANEFINRLNNNGKLPMITSCSPGWVKFIEEFYPELLDHLSSAKSPMSMFGSIVKSYYAKTNNIDPKKIYTVAVMPCIAKKFEANRDELVNEYGLKDTDAVITTRELASMLREASIDLAILNEEEYDNPLGMYSGAGAIFGTTGGVMEAALRTVADIIEKKDIQEIDYTFVRGEKGIKTASLNLMGKQVNIAVASGLSNARKLMEEIKAGKSKYQFIEIMACPGGCINGGGQPIHTNMINHRNDIIAKRRKALYSIDEAKTIRKSHQNPEIKRIYDEFLEKPNSKIAHKLLHTKYKDRSKEI